MNDHPSLLDAAISNGSDGKITGPIAWKSPLRAQNHDEYQDNEFLRRLGVELTARPLHDFWPSGGPRWDGLGVSADGSVILVEAKAHAGEVKTDCRATSPESRERIRAALSETKRAYGVDESFDWTRDHYQYANRLAHLHLLRNLNELNAWLVFLYFVGDAERGGPSRAEDWRPVHRSVDSALGIRRQPPFALNAYLDVLSLGPVATGAGGAR